MKLTDKVNLASSKFWVAITPLYLAVGYIIQPTNFSNIGYLCGYATLTLAAINELGVRKAKKDEIEFDTRIQTEKALRKIFKTRQDLKMHFHEIDKDGYDGWLHPRIEED